MREIYGYRVDADRGVVYGLRGKPIGSLDTCGYLQIDARNRPEIPTSMLSVHQAIWIAVNGPIPPGLEVNHKNGIKTDNRIANLELVTRRENILHAYRSGLKSNKGESHPGHRLNEQDVREIRRLRASGQTLSQIAEQFGVTLQNIGFIVRRQTWAHVGD